ncbi:unnamed protein product [Boreogadus saida]
MKGDPETPPIVTSHAPIVPTRADADSECEKYLPKRPQQSPDESPRPPSWIDRLRTLADAGVASDPEQRRRRESRTSRDEPGAAGLTARYRAPPDLRRGDREPPSDPEETGGDEGDGRRMEGWEHAHHRAPGPATGRRARAPRRDGAQPREKGVDGRESAPAGPEGRREPDERAAQGGEEHLRRRAAQERPTVCADAHGGKGGKAEQTRGGRDGRGKGRKRKEEKEGRGRNGRSLAKK